MGESNDIDPEIKGVVALMNGLGFLRTAESCSGHKYWERVQNKSVRLIRPYIGFSADTDEAYKFTEFVVTEAIKVGVDCMNVDFRLIPKGTFDGDRNLGIQASTEKLDEILAKHEKSWRKKPEETARMIKQGIIDYWTAVEIAVMNYKSR
jgi:hypothetical protein